MAKPIIINGFKCSAKTGMPLGRPPADAARFAVYNAIKKNAMSAQMNGKLDKFIQESAPVDVPEIEEDDEVILERIEERFNILRTFAEGACEGSVPSLIVSGAGGVGKTHTINEIVEQYAADEGVIVDTKSGVISPINLYMILYMNRFKNHVLVLDDADNVFWNEDALSILKAALDTKPKRKVSWASQSTTLNDNDIPKEFVFEGSVIFITNIDFQSIVDSGRGKLAPHLEALMTRTIYLDLRLHRTRDVALWVDYMVQENDILVNQCGLTVAQQEQVLEYIHENMHNLRNLSIRSAVKIGRFMKMQPKGWKSYANQVELRESI